MATLITLTEQPQWFYSVIALIEILGIMTAFSISYLGYKAYKLMKDKRMLFFTLGFLFIGLNSAAHAALNLILNFNFANVLLANRNHYLLLGGLFGIYYFFIVAVMLAYTSFIIMYSKLEKKDIIFFLFLLTFLIGTFLFRSYYQFNLMSAVLLGFVVFYTGKNYFKKKSTNAFLVFASFTLMTLSHILVLAENLWSFVYLLRYLFLLIGFILLLSMMLRVYLAAKKRT